MKLKNSILINKKACSIAIEKHLVIPIFIQSSEHIQHISLTITELMAKVIVDKTIFRRKSFDILGGRNNYRFHSDVNF